MMCYNKQIGGFVFMEEVYSKSKDCVWLAQQLKNQMGGNISFNKFGIDNPILTGVYSKSGIGGPYYAQKDVRFFIKYCKNDFLRIQIDIGCNSSEDIACAMNELIQALALIKQEDTLIGFPLAIYETGGCLTSEYAFKNLETVIESLKNNTIFDNDCIRNLRFLSICSNCIMGSYAYEVESGKETLYCTDGGCDTQTQENRTCISHEFADGESLNIKLLCRSICDNNR